MRYRYRTDEEMKDSGVEWIGKIPKEWDLKSLKFGIEDIIDNRGKTPPIEEIGIPLLEIDSLIGLNYNPSTDKISKFVSKETYDKFLRKYLKEGDILFATVGSIGRVAIVPKYFNYCIAQNIVGFRTNNKIYNKYLLYYMNSTQFKATMMQYNKGNIQDSIKISNLIQGKVIVPSIMNQEKIANFLDEKTSQFDLIISKKEELIKKLEEAKKSLISEVVTGKVKVVKTDDGYELVKRSSEEMKASGVEWLGQIPKDWEVKKIKHVALLKSGDSITSEKIEEEGQYPVYGGNGLRGYTGSYTHDGRYILIGRQGALCGNINYANDKFWASEHAVVVNPIITVDLIWLGELLRSMNLNQYSVSAAQPGLAVGMIQNLYIPYTNIENQINITKYISEKIKNIDTTIDKTKLQIEKLKEAKQSLISEAVTGKIEILD